VLHVLAGLGSVVAGVLATSARKRPGRHPKAGTVYLWGIGAVFVTASVMASLRWQRDRHLFVVACVAFAAALTGWLARRRRWRHWLYWHAIAMSGSYVALFTGFYVDNGPRLPLWNRLPPLSFWFLPAAVGLPLLLIAMARNGMLRRRRRAEAANAGGGGRESNPPDRATRPRRF
jgi:hypothetical protein